MSFSVKLDFVSSLINAPRVDTLMDIGCISGLTPIGKPSNPMEWVTELNSNGKVSRCFKLMLHNVLMLMQNIIQPCLSKCRGEIKILASINFKAPWSFRQVEPLFCFHLLFSNKAPGMAHIRAPIIFLHHKYYSLWLSSLHALTFFVHTSFEHI